MLLNVNQWLEELGLGRYVAAFAENDIDSVVLPALTNDDLKELGVSSIGHRKKLLGAIALLAENGAENSTEPTSSRSEAERRQLTVMFCDLVGSTELSQQLDPEDMREINRAYQDAVKLAIERFEGFVARYMGDGVLAYFGYPQAHEDDAERAIRSGLDVVDAIVALNADFNELQNVELAVRVGIATGSVVVGDLIGEGASQESAVVGETPNLAARLQGLAQPNEVVVAANTRNLVGETFELVDCATTSVKGFADPVHSWRVLRERQAESRFEASHAMQLASLVGRDEELDILFKRWNRAAHGEGQIVLISGEAGIGKSRLMQAFRERLLELLNLLVSQIVGERVLVLLTHRPEFQAPWTGEAHVTSLVMTKLAKNQCLALMDNVADEQTLPDDVRKQIVERTDGSPLFVEGLTKDYLDKTLRAEATDETNHFGVAASTNIPETLKDSSMARLDRLGSGKELAQVGSVMSREFGHE